MAENETSPVIFVLDDNPDLLAFVVLTLGVKGFTVETFTQPAALLERLAARRPDVILIDIRMPGMNGHQVFREIRARERSIPIIVISASEKQEDAIEALRLRAFDFLRKPFHDFTLVNAIRRALAPGADDAPLVPDAPAGSTTLNDDRLLNVLLADDSESNRLLIAHYLGNTPYQLVQATSGAEALERFEAGSFHVVLMDMKMPGMDGLTATRRLREMEKRLGRRRTPVIALSAHALPEQIKASLAAGCDLHVTKPIMRETLLTRIFEVTKELTAPRAMDDESVAAAPSIPDRATVAPASPLPEPFAVPGHLMFQYAESLRQNLEELRNSLAAGDLGAAGVIGHNIRGTGASYGFTQLTELGAAIELASESGDAPSIQSAIDDVAAFLTSLAHRMAQQGGRAMWKKTPARVAP